MTHDIQAREDAKSRFLTYYNTHRLCARGHRKKRHVDTDNCSTCVKSARSGHDVVSCRSVLVAREDYQAIIDLAAALNRARFGNHTPEPSTGEFA